MSKSTLNVDLSHRLAVSIDSGSGDVIDSVMLMAERGMGVLNLLCLQFEGGDNTKLSDSLNASAIDSVIHELMDIEAVMRAFSKAESNKRQA